MTRQNNSGMGLLTAALSFIALGTVGPFALILLTILFAMMGSGGGMGAAMAGMAGMLVIMMILLVLAFIGQIMCFFAPLSQETKHKLGVCMVLGMVNWFLGGGLIGSLVSIGGLIAYLTFLYGLCTDLEAPELAKSFNSAAGFGFIALCSTILAPFSVFVSPGLMLLFFICAFLFGALCFARYAQTIISLAQRANQLRLQGVDLSATQNSGPGFSRFEEEAPVPAKPVRPEFQMEWSGLVHLPGDLSGPHEATRVGDVEKVAAMLRPGKADVKGPSGLTPLHVAAISGVMQVADMLLKKGANIDDPCDGGLTALYFAIQSNNGNLVGLLLQRGANLNTRNEQGRTPLHWAAAVPSDRLEGQARVRMVQMLLSRGADPQAQDNDGCTPAQLAEKAGYDDVAAAFS